MIFHIRTGRVFLFGVARMVPCSATAFINDSLLAVAKGSFVEFYDTTTGSLVSTIKPFEKTSVHLIVSCLDLILVVGNTNLQVWKLEAGVESLSFIRIDAFRCPFRSRILDANLMENNEPGRCRTALVVAFSHNFVEIWDYSLPQTPLYRVLCQDRCFL